MIFVAQSELSERLFVRGISHDLFSVVRQLSQLYV